MRRSDREIKGLSNILAVLDKCDVMRIGLCADNIPYIVPMNFAYEVLGEKVFIYFHCASEGKKISMIVRNDNVCFEADCSYKTLQGESACNWSAEFESVIGEGTVKILTEEQNKINALDLIMKRYGFIGKPDYSQNALKAVIILKISVTSITGKSKLLNP